MNFFNNNNNRCNNDSCNSQTDSCCNEKDDCSCCTTCSPGTQGPAGGVLNFADFYALMPPDNAATVAPGTSQIVGMALVETTVINSILTVRNPAGNPTALGITPLAGGTRPVSAHLVIILIQ